MAIKGLVYPLFVTMRDAQTVRLREQRAAQRKASRGDFERLSRRHDCLINIIIRFKIRFQQKLLNNIAEKSILTSFR
ncbi:hypothetical protein [Nitratireductor soli]|uniref:hypothetical protein n=1 Tax=Nitratireductor soli TaxID=1670619 RepID=UPI000AA3ED45|nr:hypothetical protein [Nitratireductor soli]